MTSLSSSTRVLTQSTKGLAQLERPSIRHLLALLVAPTVFFVTSCATTGGLLYALARDDYRGKAGFEQKQLDVDGHRIVYLERPGDAASAVLLVHGFGADKDNWTLMTPHVDDNRRIVAIDLPGFGESSFNAEHSYDVRSQAVLLSKIATSLGLRRFNLVGHSMGGAISAAFAIEYPERVRSLTLIAASGVKGEHPSDVDKGFARGENLLLVNDIEDFDRFMTLSFVSPPEIPDVVKSHFAHRAVASRSRNDAIFRQITDRPYKLVDKLDSLSGRPVSIIWCDADRIIDPSAADVFVDKISGSTLTVFKACGHAPMIERPAKTAEVLERFWSGVDNDHPL